MKFEETKISGCYIINPNIQKDSRGFFVKTFHHDVFKDRALDTDFREEYYSYSEKNVLRGMHFQLPPHDHAKLVYCVSGSVLDAVVDLRQNSKTFRQYATFELSVDNGKVLYIPKGIAHGFYVTGEHACMVYNATTVYSPAHDSGILWESCGVTWPSLTPTISNRDEKFCTLADFKSPF